MIIACALPVRLDGRTTLLLWASDDGADRVVADGNLVVAFDDLDELRAHATTLGLEVEPEPSALVDLDASERWCRSGGDPDPVLLIDTWNLCWDVSNGSGTAFEHRSDELDVLYDKLFYANNLPSVTPPGERWEPEWPQEQVAGLRELIGRGIALVRSSLSARGPELR